MNWHPSAEVTQMIIWSWPDDDVMHTSAQCTQLLKICNRARNVSCYGVMLNNEAHKRTTGGALYRTKEDRCSSLPDKDGRSA